MSKSAAEWKAAGNAALGKQAYDEAIAAYTEAIALDPHDHIFYSNRSAAYLSKGDAAAALKDGEKCVDLRPDFGKGHGRVGAALYALGSYDDAAVAYSKGLKVDPANDALRTGLEDAKAAAARAASAANPFGGDMLGRLAANPKFAAHMADPAFVAKLKLLQTDPQAIATVLGGGAGGSPDPRMLEVIGFLLGAELRAGPGGGGGDEDGAFGGGDARPSSAEDEAAAEERKAAAAAAAKAAEEEARKAAEEAADPELAAKRERKRAAVAKKEEGNAAYKARRFADALAAYRSAAELDDEDITFLVNQAAVHFETGDLDACVATCRAAIERGRAIFAPYPAIAKAFARIGNAEAKRGALQAAIDAYESSLLESHSEEVSDKLKKLRAEKKRADEAAYRDPTKAEEAKARGNEAFKAGDFPRAIAEYSEAIKRAPDNAVYWTNRATARIKLMDWSAASADLDASIKLDPKYARAYVRKGALQTALKEFHKAMDSYNKALELEPDSAEAKEGLRGVVSKINASQAAGAAGADPERARRALEDPEIQAILRDPMVSAALEDMQTDPAASRRVLSDPAMAGKIQKLIAAGVLSVR